MTNCGPQLAFRAPREVADEIIAEQSAPMDSLLRGSLKAAMIRELIARDAYWKQQLVKQMRGAR